MLLYNHKTGRVWAGPQVEMEMMTTRHLITSAILGTALLTSPALAQDEVKIGAILPMTGSAASYGEWMRNGMNIAVD